IAGGKAKKKARAGGFGCDSRVSCSPNWLGVAAGRQRNDVGSGGQSGGHLGGIPSGENQVVIFTGPKTTEDRSHLLRFDQRQVAQENEDVFGGLQPRGDEGNFDILVMEVPSERSGQTHRSLIYDRRKDSGGGVVEYDAKFPFIFAAELAHLERTGAGRGFPVDMAGGV